jgi:hypothetical protein
VSDILQVIAERMAERRVGVAELAAHLPDRIMMARNGYGWRLARALTGTDLHGRPTGRRIQRVSFEMLDKVLRWLDLAPSNRPNSALRAAIADEMRVQRWTVKELAAAARVPERTLYRLLQADDRRLARLTRSRRGCSWRISDLGKKPVTLTTLNAVLLTLKIRIEATTRETSDAPSTQ